MMTALLRPAAVILIALTLLLSGCVRSRAVITSDPPRADVHMNDVHLGPTPVEVPFTWYWYYDFKAEKPGFEDAIQRERFRPPVYLAFPLDLLMEAMPFPVYDTKRVHLTLEPQDTRPAPETIDS